MGRPVTTCECGECRKCKQRAYGREWYRRKTVEERRELVARRDPEKVREADRRRSAKPARQADNARKTKAWRAVHPERYRAHTAVSNAIRDGRLEKKPCEVCGSTERIHGHHDDYTKPLEVRWLCPKHHAEHHRQLRAA